MASLKELRERWKTTEGKEKVKSIIKFLESTRETRARDEKEKFDIVYYNLKSRLKDFPFADDIPQVDFRGIDLEGEDLQILFLRNVGFSGANLKNTNFMTSRLKYVNFSGADLTESKFVAVRCEGPTFGYFESIENCTNIEKADLRYAKFNNILYSDLKYGGYDLKTREQCEKAEGSYRVLKKLFKEQGEYEKADDCYINEMRAKRKQRNIIVQFFEWLLFDLTCRYGMKPLNVIFWIGCVIIIFMVLYAVFRDQFIYSNNIQVKFSILKALYFSVITFTTLGIGDWHPNPNHWIQYCVMLEAFLGVILIALFIITFTRKIIRD